MELNQALAVLRRWWWLMILVAGINGAAAFWFSTAIIDGTVAARINPNMRPAYEATTTLQVYQVPPGTPGSAANLLYTTDNPPRTMVELLQIRPVIDEVIANLRLNTTYDILTQHYLSITIIRDTPLVVIAAQDSDPQRAADIANEIPRVFLEQNRESQQKRFAATKQYLEQEVAKAQLAVTRTQAELEALKASDSSADQVQLQVLLSRQQSNYQSLLQNLEQVRLEETRATDFFSVVSPAVPPTFPVRPRPITYSVLAAIVGLMLAGAAVYLRESLDDTLESSEEVEHIIGVPPLGAIARIPGSEMATKLHSATDADSPIAEAYRVLAARVEFSETDQPIRTVVVTSSVPREGKTTTAANLAVALAQSGKRVILVDADLRLPQLHDIFQQDNADGVSTLLAQRGECDVADHLVGTGVGNLYLLPSGLVVANPVELLGSPRMAMLIEALRSQSDVVVFDCPPVLGVADATRLAHVCDAVLLVARGGVTRATALARAKNQLLGAGAVIVGVVLNATSSPEEGYDSYHNYYNRRNHFLKGFR